MKRVAVPPLLLMSTACSTHRQVEQQRVHADTIHALLAEQLSVRLDDVIIVPRDSVSPVIAARRAEVSRQTDVEVSRRKTVAEQVSEQTQTEAPRIATPPLWSVIALAIILLLFFRSLCRVRRGG